MRVSLRDEETSGCKVYGDHVEKHIVCRKRRFNVMLVAIVWWKIGKQIYTMRCG